MALPLHLSISSPSLISHKSAYSKPLLLLPSNRRSTSLRKLLTVASSFDLDASASPILVSENGKGGGACEPAAAEYASSWIEVDAVTEAELKENGFRSTRLTKLICTIVPATCGSEELEALAVGGMNVARITMCHGTKEWHKMVIERVRRLNEEKGFAVAVMMDTEGSEIHMGDLGSLLKLRMVKFGHLLFELWRHLFRCALSR